MIFNNECLEEFKKQHFNLGRIIAFSKSEYLNKHREDLVIFNANVLTLKHGLVWYGDLNINKDRKVLELISKNLKEDLFILREHDCQIDDKKEDISNICKVARYVIRCAKS